MMSLDPTDILLTTAEVSIAFAGFASLIAILGMRAAEKSAHFDLFRYWVMLEFTS